MVMGMRLALDAEGECELGPEVGAAGERLLQEVPGVILLCLRLGREQTYALIDQSHCAPANQPVCKVVAYALTEFRTRYTVVYSRVLNQRESKARALLCHTSIAATGGALDLPLTEQQ